MPLTANNITSVQVYITSLDQIGTSCVCISGIKLDICRMEI